MYSIILAFRVLEAKIGHPGPIASPAAEDGSGWRRCGTGWHRLRGCNVSGRADFGRPFGNRTGTSGYRHPGGKQAEEFRYAAVLPALPTRADGIRFGSVTAPRFRSRGTSSALLRGAGCPVLPDPASRSRRCTLLGEASRFAFTAPENLRPSTRHRNLHQPTHTDINKTASQQNYTTTRLHNDTTTKQNSTTEKQEPMTSVSTDVNQSVGLFE